MMHTLSTFTLVALLAIFHALLDAQVSNVTFERVTSPSPIEGTEVHCICQDHLGYLWVGTEKALNRYDGHGFTVFKHDPVNDASIVFARVQSLLEDTQGILWIGTYNGLERFDRVRKSFTHFVPNPTAPAGDWSNVIYGMCEDRYGNLWLGGDGLRILDRSTGKLTIMRHDSLNPGSVLVNNCDAIFEDSKGTLWIATKAGLDCYDRLKRTFRHLWVDEGYRQGREANFWGNHWIQQIHEDRRGRLWLCTNAGPVLFDRAREIFKPYSINGQIPDSSGSHSVSSMCEDDEGNLWIGTWGGGLMCYDEKADTFLSVPSFKSLVPGNSIATLYRDHSGTIWIGTTGDGLWKMKSAKGLFTAYSHIAARNNVLSSNEVRFFYRHSHDTIAVATNVGADLFARRTGLFRPWVPEDGPYAFSGWIRSRTGVIYTGTIPGRLHTIHERPYQRRSFTMPGVDIAGGASSLFEDRNGLIWMVACEAGVYQFDPATEKFRHFEVGRPPTFLSAGSTFSNQLILEDSLDNTGDGWGLWIGTQDGLWHYDARSESFTQLAHDSRAPTSISSNFVNSVFRDSRGILWIGTDEGLDKMGPDGRAVTCYDQTKGLPDPHVLGILEDRRGRLWISTRTMLSRFDPQTEQISNYSVRGVIQDIQFAPGCCLRGPGGEMYFGGQGGFVLFYPDSIKGNTRVPPVVVTGFRKLETALSVDSVLGQGNTIELSYKDYDFSFEFASLDFTSPEDNQYAYMLEGYDIGWNYVGNRQFAHYRNVEPGRYTFRVKGSNNDGMWNDEGASVAVVISPPLWKTAWFSVSVWAAALLVVGGSIRNIERRKLKKRIAELEKERAVERERTRISQDMHDEVGSSLSEIAILSELAKKKPEEAKDRVEAISERTAELIDNVSEIVWAMNPKNDTLDHLVSHLRLYAGKYLEIAGIGCSFAGPESVPTIPLAAEARRNLFLVVKEALHNVVKHSAASIVTIVLTFENRRIEIRIEDNGKGFQPETLNSPGNGLDNMKKRMRAVGFTLGVQSAPGCGTRLVITAGL